MEEDRECFIMSQKRPCTLAMCKRAQVFPYRPSPIISILSLPFELGEVSLTAFSHILKIK